MTLASTQAGNRASKTWRYLQWQDSVPEQNAVASVQQNLRHSTFCFPGRSRKSTARVLVLANVTDVAGLGPDMAKIPRAFATPGATAFASTSTRPAAGPGRIFARACNTTNTDVADGHTASNAPDLFRPPKLSGAGPG